MVWDRTRGLPMNGEDKQIADHIKATLGLADEIVKSVDENADEAFLKAIGVLAQVIFQIVPHSNREEMIDIATAKLRDYMNLLDQMEGIGELLERHRH
jgi:hypothetical protein